MKTMQYLFVYGTLRTTEGHPMHNYLRAYCAFLGPATIGGIKIDLGDYPGLLPSSNPEDRVPGELYQIDEGASELLFEVLDRYEGCHPDDPEPHEYFRHRQPVLLDIEPEGEPYDAWVYLYNG